MELLSWVSLAILNSSLALSLPQAEETLPLSEPDMVQVVQDVDSAFGVLMASKSRCHRALIETVPSYKVTPLWTEAARSIRSGAVVFESKDEQTHDHVKLEIRPGPVWSGMAARLRF